MFLQVLILSVYQLFLKVITALNAVITLENTDVQIRIGRCAKIFPSHTEGIVFVICVSKTVRIEIKGTEFGGTFFLQPDRPCFFQTLGKKNEKLFVVTWNRGDTMGVSGYGIFFHLWAVCARSA